jgi:hypothetical protein
LDARGHSGLGPRACVPPHVRCRGGCLRRCLGQRLDSGAVRDRHNRRFRNSRHGGFLIERRFRTTIPVESTEQRERLSSLPEAEEAIRAVFAGVVDIESDTHFIYSSTLVEYFRRDDNRRVDYPFMDEELQVTAIVDAQGISKVQSLLYLAGKRKRLHIATSRSFRPEYWDDQLILIGSPNANLQTERALRDYNSPFRFDDDVRAGKSRR